MRRVLPDDGSPLLLVIDQFEELFTQATPDDARRRSSTPWSARSRTPTAGCASCVTLRADFYDRPLRHRAFGELLRRGTEVVTPMGPAELERAIDGPAERAGVRFEPGLVAEIVADVADRAGALPLLQYALTELFDGRRGPGDRAGRVPRSWAASRPPSPAGPRRSTTSSTAARAAAHPPGLPPAGRRRATARRSARRRVLRQELAALGGPQRRRRARRVRPSPPADVRPRSGDTRARPSRSPTRRCSRRGTACAAGSRTVATTSASSAGSPPRRRSGRARGATTATSCGARSSTSWRRGPPTTDHHAPPRRAGIPRRQHRPA